MPNRGRHRKSGAPGEVSNSVPTTPMVRHGVDKGQRTVPQLAYQGVMATGIDGTKLMTFSTYEPIFLNRPKIIAFESVAPSCDQTCSGTNVFSMNTSLANNFQNQYTVLVDNIARATANAQLLPLALGNDFAIYVNTWLTATAGYMGLISILNGDGFNERCTNLAQALTQFRSRIQTGYDRLSLFPIPPGFIDIVYRSFGLFASGAGNDCYLNILNTTSAGVPLDMTVAANINTLLTSYETALAGLMGSILESSVIRIVCSEYYGAPAQLPYPGVRVSRCLYDQFRLMATNLQATTNVFGGPYIENGAILPSPGATIPVLIPKGYESDPWWLSYYRFAPFLSFNNVAKVNTQYQGVFFPSTTNSTADRIYIQGGTVTATETITAASLDGYTKALNELYYAPYAASSALNGYATDTRVQNDFTVIMASMDTIGELTMQMQTHIVAGKGRLAPPSGLQDYTSMGRTSVRV